MLLFRFCCVLSFCLAPVAWASAADPEVADRDKKEKPEEITLERMFPKEGLFGPRASGAAFSADGRFAAYLYRSYPERRHGNDLWIYDFEQETHTRVTSLARMTEFQRSARYVAQERLKQAEKESKEGKKEEDSEDEESGDETEDGTEEEESEQDDEGEEDADEAEEETDAGEKDELSEEAKRERDERINRVSDDDAEDDYGPRYSGVSGFEWHPSESSLLFFSEGDVYHVADASEPGIERLTNTTLRETQVDYLPDGSGYSYRVNNAICRLRFDSHRIDQLNPRMPPGQNLSGYTVSPDGERLALVARKNSEGKSGGNRRVDIIRYRDRFAEADSVRRPVSDDATQVEDVYVYLYDLTDTGKEEPNLLRVFHTQVDEPRDVISRPRWSLDSEKVTFCFFNQEDSEVQIRVAGFPEEDELKKLVKKASKAAVAEREKQEKKARKEEEEKGFRSKVKLPAINLPLTIKSDATTVYRFKHDGGPNTPRMVSPDWADDSRHVIFVSEQSGFRHVHRLDTLYQSVKQLTGGYYEVYPKRFSEDHKTLFVTATRDDPAREMVYSVDTESGEMTRLSERDGTYSGVAVSDDGRRLLANFVTYGELPQVVRQAGGEAETLANSHAEDAAEVTERTPEFFRYENRYGHEIRGLVHKPDGWEEDPEKKYPLLVYVYGGPLGTRKSVVDGSYQSSVYFFGRYMAEKHGYVSVVIDPRGQSGYGGLFEKANYERVGKPQVEDLVDGVKHLREHYGVDDSRVAIHGWSFGGFQTQMCLYTEPDVFQVGIAGAGPTEWENYTSWYTTGTVGPSKKGTPDQKKYSLRPLAEKLEGQLLLVHGMEDTNVLFQDTVAIYRDLLRAGKETHVELFLDPTGGHGLGGDVKTLNRMKKYEEFLLRTIGAGKPKEAELSD